MSKKKIALVGFRLNKGGSERVMANLSSFFHQNNLEVHIIIVIDDIKYPHSGTVFNLGKLKSKSNTIFNKIKRFYHFNKYIKKQGFDFIIDFRFRTKPIQEFIITKFVYNTKSIFTVHHSKIHEYMPNFPQLTRLLYGKSFAVISICKSMQNKIIETHNLKNVVNIYNPVDIYYIQDKIKEETDIEFEYIIGVGHYYSNLKQFDKLIEAYAKSVLPGKNIHLVILGTGELEDYLIRTAEENNVKQFVHLFGFKTNPFKYINKAKYFVLSSLIEGFPMVVLEALACGTPVIAFDCQTGPGEILIDKKNGLLIEDQNFDKLISGMNTLIIDQELYLKCKKHSLTSVEKFSVESIGKQWLDLMNNIP